MKLVQFCSLFTFFVSIIDAQSFRCDYTYFEEADGYLKYHEIPANWQEARLRCHLEGTTLASPITPGIKQAMRPKVNGTCVRGVWTGIHSTFSGGDYASIEGVPLSEIEHSWMKCEPDNYEDGESCLLQLPNGKFADASCNETLPYFCYQKASSRMIMNTCGSMDSEYALRIQTGKCYKFHKIARTWSRAYMTCQAEGGHLAIINSDSEAYIIKELFSKYPASAMGKDQEVNVAHIGFHNWNEVGEWRTIHGQTLKDAGYEKWAPDEPNTPKEQHCGAVYRSGLLDDGWCHSRATFICEKDPQSLVKCDTLKKTIN